MRTRDIIENLQPIFQQLHAEADQRKELKVAPGTMPDTIQLHIAFALDCTGSMQPWIAAARQQIRSITEAIVPKVKETVPEVQLALKFGLVAYRDYEDVLPGAASHIHSFGDLTDNPEDLKNWLESEKCKPYGGGDLPEDVLGGLSQAIDLLTTQGEAVVKFIVLIGDGPAHGPDCNNGLADRYPNGCPGQQTFTVQEVMQRMQKEHIDLLMTRIKPAATDMMQEAFRSQYDMEEFQVKMSFADMFDHTQPPRSSCHLVFCLDASSSMEGEKWAQAMANAAGGTFKPASTGDDLMRIFEAAAQGCNAVDGLVKRFGETISNLISTKVVLDHM
ncbi:hypothetical protein WJX84_010889 [Apatococcus fuscideae]|uniref:VWFA domain-containing protein n=1 Tax=Apatococcus fuscideae TaxID=2026836 RepID=A0AAW1SQ68_9CHLO